MSCNLDHVLYDMNNIDDVVKEKNAHNFAKNYKNHIQEFVSFMTQSSFSIIDDFDESWEHIKKDENSLKRYSNLGIAFKNIVGENKE